MLAGALGWLADRENAADGVEITYTRDGETPVTLTAVLGQDRDALIDGDGPSIRVEALDVLIKPADLIIAGSPTEPIAGDEIAFTDANGNDRTVRVSVRDGDDVWRWADPHHTRMRIHTVEV